VDFPMSSFSQFFGGGGTVFVEKPTILTPTDGSNDVWPEITTTAFSASILSTPHDATEWQIATDYAFTNILNTLLSTSQLLSYTPSVGDPSTQYYVRVRHTSGVFRSEYSDTVSYTTPAVKILAPTLSYSEDAQALSRNPTITTSAFTTVPASSDTHQSTTWKIFSGSTLVYQSVNDTVNLTSITLPSNTLDFLVNYTVSVRFNGTNTGGGFEARDFVKATGLTGQDEYTTPGTYSWICPQGVEAVSVLLVGGGGGGMSTGSGGGNQGGGGGALAYKNNIPVVAGQSYTVVVGDGGLAGWWSTRTSAGSVTNGGDSTAFEVIAGGGLHGHNG
jgi:hypothetical protein